MDPDGDRRGNDLTIAAEALPRSVTPRPAGAAMILAVVVLQMIRIQGIPVWDTIWLEDSDVYVTQANLDGPLAVLFRGYAGYLQLLPRLLALPAAALPVDALPFYLALAGSLVSAGAAAFVNRSLGGWVATAPVRVAVSAMVAISPALAIENTAVITNTIWTGFLCVPFALVSTRAGRWDLAARSTVCLLAGTSTALCALYAPVALGVWAVRRTRDSLLVGIVLAVSLVVQGTVVLSTELADGADNSARTLIDMYGVRVLGSLLLGERPLDQLWTSVGEPIVPLFAGIVTAIGVALARGAARRERVVAGLFVGLSVLGFVVPVWLRGSEGAGFALGVYTQSWTRYTIAPILFLLTAVAVLVDPPGPSRERRAATVGRTALVVWVAVLITIGLPVRTVRSEGPRWSEEVSDTYRSQCIGASPDTVVFVTASPPNFAAALPCHRLGP